MIGIQALTGSNPTQLLENSDTGASGARQRCLSPHQDGALSLQDRYQTAAEALQALQLANLQLPTKLNLMLSSASTAASMPGERAGEAGEDLERLSTVTFSPVYLPQLSFAPPPQLSLLNPQSSFPSPLKTELVKTPAQWRWQIH